MQGTVRPRAFRTPQTEYSCDTRMPRMARVPTACSHCSECNTAEAKVTVIAYLTPCFNDCGPYGQCSLLRRHGYLYAGCSCKAGECIFLGGLAIFHQGKATFFRFVV